MFFLVKNISSDLYDLIYLGALFQAKIDIERLYDNHSLYSSTHFHQNSVPSRANRLLFVL